MKIFPFFFPFGGCTPTGVTMLSFGMLSSFSVYARRFFAAGTGSGFVFCCRGGGALVLDFSLAGALVRDDVLARPLPFVFDFDGFFATAPMFAASCKKRCSRMLVNQDRSSL
jgi:hypothetical protein